MKTSESIRVVDLFCGCGGLALGFSAHSGQLSFETMLGIDNEESAIRIFNDNFRTTTEMPLAIGRVADVTWFAHPTEIQLYYLSHCAYAKGKHYLKKQLKDFGYLDFLSTLRDIDATYNYDVASLMQTDAFQNASKEVDKATFNIALVKGASTKLGVRTLINPAAQLRALPWTDEYSVLLPTEPCNTVNVNVSDDIADATKTLWLDILKNLADAAGKTGRGQNARNSERLKQLLGFLQTDSGEDLFRMWLAWRTKRESLRADFCLSKREEIGDLYSNERVHILLGGPPCKGFSRIGRPVIASLRDQGVHAWSHHEFGDERNALMVQYVLFIEALKPDVFLFENVANFQSTLKTPSGTFDAPQLLEEIIEDLSTDGLCYHISHKLVNSKQYSVPQDRSGFIMFGANARKKDPSITDAFFSHRTSNDFVSLESALWGLPDAAEFSSQGNVTARNRVNVYEIDSQQMQPHIQRYWDWIRQNDPFTKESSTSTNAHIYRRMRHDDHAFLKYVAPNIRWMDLKIRDSESLSQLASLLAKVRDLTNDKSLLSNIDSALNKLDDSFFLRILLEQISVKFKLAENHLLDQNYLKNGHGRHGDWFERLSTDKPCKTIVAHIGKDTYGYFHPYKNRAITIREAARIQSFPDWFSFGSAGVVNTYTAIGNAVSPLVANAFAETIERLHKKDPMFIDEELRTPSIRKRKEQLSMQL